MTFGVKWRRSVIAIWRIYLVADDEDAGGCFDGVVGEPFDLEYPIDLREEPLRRAEVAAGDAFDGGDGLRIGVIAVLPAGPGAYELAKMTVGEAARGHGVGRQLIQAAITWTREHNGDLLFLGTNTKLAAAIRLYEATGFQRTSIDELGLENYYARADTLMKLNLSTCSSEATWRVVRAGGLSPRSHVPLPLQILGSEGAATYSRPLPH